LGKLKLILSVLIILLVRTCSFGQVITGIIYDKLTRKPVPNAEIIISNNHLNYQVNTYSNSNSDGSFTADVTNFDNIDSILNVKVSKEEFETAFFGINRKSANTYNFKLAGNYYACSFDTALIYETGQIEIYCNKNYILFDLVSAIDHETDFLIVFTFYYSEEEKDGYNISLARANYISSFISKYGALSQNYTIRIVEGSKSMFTVKAKLKN